MGRKYKNATAGAVFAYSGFPMGLKLLGLIGVPGDLAAIAGLFEVYESPNLNWNAVFVFLMIFSGSLIAAFNWDIWQRRGSRKRHRSAKNWNTKIGSAINYVSDYSIHSAGYDGAKAIAEAARCGDITARGVPRGRGKPRIIPRRSWRWAKLDTETGDLVSTITGRTKYSGIVVKQWELHKVWPSRNDERSWMAN